MIKREGDEENKNPWKNENSLKEDENYNMIEEMMNREEQIKIVGGKDVQGC